MRRCTKLVRWLLAALLFDFVSVVARYCLVAVNRSLFVF